MKYATLLLICLMAGCVSPEQIAARQAAEAEAQEQRNIAYTRALAAQCDTVGYKRDTDAWRNCLMSLHQQNQAQNAAMRQMVIQQYMQNTYRPATQTNCQRDFMGNVNCISR